MKLYHGTNVDFEQIDVAKSKPNIVFCRTFDNNASSVSF